MKIRTAALLFIVCLFGLSQQVLAASPRTGNYSGGRGLNLISFQINGSSQVDAMSGLMQLRCRATDGSTSTYSLSFGSGAGPIRIRGGTATLRRYTYNFSSDTRLTLSGNISAREVTIAAVLRSSESTCRGNLRTNVRRTTASLVKNYDTDAADLRGSVALVLTGNKVSLFLVYVLGVCDGITHVISVGDTAEPSEITYDPSGDFEFSVHSPGETSTTDVSVAATRNNSSDSYTLAVTGSVTNELGTCPFSGSFEAART